ncbi:Protein BONZAI 3 [Vitis vinifera]|uniref:Protein BONZAI 3 n=1 Tax=Vitis vinifera TaxID=29760 RepID=A0A438HKZ4_VITVI|nr:Protein BONZAI 3 [Vitis vinifera]RVW85079.1 Protein BONZAI 3 [Vitis vinifera]
MAAYASALNHVALAGPTLFGQVINNVVEIVGQSLCYNNYKYFVLLIIKDGVLTDLQETKYALSSAGRVSTRDIVQFVPMREVCGGQTFVVEALLEELPG